MKLISVQEAGERLGVSPWTIRKWVSSRRLSSFKVGRRRLLAQEDVDSIIMNSRQEADPRVRLPGSTGEEGGHE